MIRLNRHLVWCSLILILPMVGCQNDQTQSLSDRLQMDHRSTPFVWGYINTDGKWTIDPGFDDARDFHSGVAAVMIDGLWGYINTSGKLIIATQYPEAHDFHGRWAKVRAENGQYGVLNKTGEWVLEPQYDQVHVTNEPFIWVKKGISETIVDSMGQPLTQEIIESATPFQNGISVIKRKGVYQLLQSDGTLSGEALSIIPTKNLPYPARDENGWNWINQEGEMISQERFDEVSIWREGYTMASREDTFWLVNEAMEPVWTKNQESEHLGHGIIAVYLPDDRLILNSASLTSTLPDTIDEVHAFHEGRAAYRVDSLWSFLTPLGESIKPPFSPLVWQFESGLSRAIVNGGIGFMDTTGQLQITADFFEVKDFSEGLARAQSMKQ